MKLRNIIIRSLFILIAYVCVGCGVIGDTKIKKCIGNAKDSIPPLIETIYEKREDILFGFGISLDAYKKKYRKSGNGLIIEKEDTLKKRDEKGKVIGLILYPESRSNSFLYGRFKNFREHTIVTDGKISKSYTQEIKGEKYSDTIVLKIKNIEICNNNFHGKFSILDKRKKSLYHTQFTNGNGYWKDFHYQEIAGKYALKEEGQVKNNFKFGKWKYYNEQGKLESVKNYSVRDSVDLRFPHCLFNENEACY